MPGAAGVRPRFGAGPGTAVRAGIIAWFAIGLLPTLFLWPAELPYPHNMTIIMMVVYLVEAPLAAVVGAKFYTEDAGAGAGAGARM